VVVIFNVYRTNNKKKSNDKNKSRSSKNRNENIINLRTQVDP